MDGMYLRSGSKLRGLFIFAYFEGSEKVDVDDNDDAKVTREVTTIFGKCQLQQLTFMTNFLIASLKRGSWNLISLLQCVGGLSEEDD